MMSLRNVNTLCISILTARTPSVLTTIYFTTLFVSRELRLLP